jgi:hypothetical protein
MYLVGIGASMNTPWLTIPPIPDLLKVNIPAITLDHSKYSMGIRSVLSRITNYLDFIIACVNPNIINFDVKNINKYKPNRRPGFENNMNVDGYDDNIDDKLSGSTSISFLTAENILDTSHNVINLFRTNLLTQLQTLIKDIIDLNLITYKFVNLTPERITCRELNKTHLKTCTGIDGKFSEMLEENIKSYITISVSLSEIIRKKLTINTTSKAENLKQLFINNTVRKIPEGTKYIENIFSETHWNAECKLKYLKYKKKYLQLKNKL